VAFVLASLAAGFVPVIAFLAGLQLMDSFALVGRRALLGSLAAGAAAAGLAYAGNELLLGPVGAGMWLIVHVLAPMLEEALKASVVVWLLRRERVGFAVDAAIHGFAVGTGFGLVENLDVAREFADQGLAFWLARGFGTAVLHGCTTAIFAIVAQGLSERRGAIGARELLPAWLLAAGLHALFNLGARDALLTAALVVTALPLLVVLTFERSERATRAWLGTGLDGEVAALEQILEGQVAGTRIGAYLETLRERFSGAVVADMLCLLRIHLELSIRAKGMLIARSVGVDLPPDASVRANLEELRFLERSIGPTGQLAVLPLRRTSRRDLWQVMLLSRRVHSRKGPC